jgi:hypothetical protein
VFWKIENGKMMLNDAEKVVQQCWLEIPQHFPDVILHEYIVMPNHIHGIVELVGAKKISPGTCADNNSGEKFFATTTTARNIPNNRINYTRI